MSSERTSWSFGLGRWGGVELRLHVSFFLVLLFVVFLAWQESTTSQTSLVGLTAAIIALWLFSVLGHEIAHAMACAQQGLSVDLIVLGPFGGLQPPRVREPFPGEAVTLLAGPMFSLILLLIGFAVVRYHGTVTLADLLQPPTLQSLLAESAEGGARQVLTCIRVLVCINAWVVLLNLLPALPSDMARLCGLLLHKLRPNWDFRQASLWVCICSRGLSFVFLVLALFLFQTDPGALLPAWLILTLLAVGTYFSARAEEQRLAEPDFEEDLFGYDFSQGYTSLENSLRPPARRPSYLRAWLRMWRRRWQQRRLRQEAWEDQQVDAILERLQAHGIQNLTAAERAILRRASVRYRSRLSE